MGGVTPPSISADVTPQIIQRDANADSDVAMADNEEGEVVMADNDESEGESESSEQPSSDCHVPRRLRPEFEVPPECINFIHGKAPRRTSKTAAPKPYFCCACGEFLAKLNQTHAGSKKCQDRQKEMAEMGERVELPPEAKALTEEMIRTDWKPRTERKKKNI